jgi:hypothetical protein
MKNNFLKKIAFVLWLSFSVNVYGQQLAKGVLKDDKSSEPVEFANIGIIGKGVGTVSNENGEFTFSIPDSLLNEKIRISRIGYKTLDLSVTDFKKQTTIKLSQNSTTLEEVAVSAKKLKVKIVGSDTKTNRVSAGFVKNNLGSELAIKIKIKNPNTQVRKFYINITKNNIAKPLFRFNVYSVDKDGRPKENILKQNILFEPKENVGLVELDLMPYSIFVDDDVFIAIEWVKDLGDVKGLNFSTKLTGGPTYFRQASQDTWNKLPSFGVGLHAEIGY